MAFTQESQTQPKIDDRKMLSRIRHAVSSGIIVMGILGCVVISALAVAATGGYFAGQKQRNVSATQTTVVDIDLQYQLGITDLANSNYQLAAERFRWVLERVPDYPEAAEHLAEAQDGIAQGSAASGTALPTLIPSTSDDPEELFNEGLAFFNSQDWSNTINRLKEVQGRDPHYREAEVKEMLYTAYSTLGLTYIRGDRIEEGLFLLEQAEQIRPLDDLTAGERYLARLYSTGHLYWDLNWPVVIDNFLAIYEIAPNYRDVSTKLWEAYVKYGEHLVQSGAACDAVQQYDNALALRDDSEVRDKKLIAEEACANPTALPTATPLGAGTPDPDETEAPLDGDATATPEYNIP
jgi:tetratricopeptide (TPR) repeat protein